MSTYNLGPCARSYSAMCGSESKIYIFGGFSDSNGWLDDFYVLDIGKHVRP